MVSSAFRRGKACISRKEPSHQDLNAQVKGELLEDFDLIDIIKRDRTGL
jgi:hypothetical protein